MLRRKIWSHAIDVIALMFGALLGVPYLLILLSPFAQPF